MARSTVELELVAIIDKASKTVEQFTRDTQKQLSSINLASVVTGINQGFDLLERTAGRAVGKIVDIFDSAIKESAAAEQAVTNLSNALRLQNDFSEQAVAEFNDYASALQSVSTFSDEAVLNSLALAKQFKATNAEAKRVVTVAADLAAVTGVDLDTATQRVAQTLNGFVDKSLTKVIPGLKSLSKEALIAGAGIDVIDQKVQGSAAALADTFSGAVIKAKNSFSDFLEGVGGLITNNPVIIEGIKQISLAFKGLNDELAKNGQEFQSLITGGFILFIESVPLVLKGIQNITTNFSALTFAGKAVGIVLGGIGAAIASFFEGNRGGGQSILQAVQDDLDDLEVQFGDFLNKTEAGFDPVIAAAQNLAIKVKEINAQAKKTAAIVNTGSSLSGAKQRAAEFKATVEEQRKAIEQATKDPIKAFLELSVKGKFDKDVGIAIGAGLVANILKGAKGAQDLVAGVLGNAADILIPGIGGAVSEIVGVLAQGKEKTKQMVEEFAKALPQIIQNLIEALPVLIEALARELPPALAKAMPFVAERFTIALIKNMPRIIQGFISGMIEAAKAFGQAAIDFIKSAGGIIPGVGNFIGDVGGGIGDFFSDISPFAEGGRIPNSPKFEGDRFPARLNAGEQVLSKDLSNQLENFLNNSSSGQPVVVNLVVGQQQLARAILDLNRGGFRTA